MDASGRTPRRWSAALAAAGAFAFVVTLAATAPASLVPEAAGLSRSGVDHEGASGTIWSGVIRRVSVDGVVIGDVAFAVLPLSLMRGALEADVASADGAVRGKGRIAFGLGGTMRASGVAATIDLPSFRHVRAMGRPLEGTAVVEDGALEMTARGRCTRAAGAVSTDAMVAVAQAYGRGGFLMRGVLACEDGDAVIALKGGADGLKASVDIRLGPGWTLVSTASLSGADDSAALALQSLGFRKDNGVWSAGTGGVSLGGS